MTFDHDIGYIEKVSLTILVDNKADLIVESNEHVKHFTEKPLLAEHGFSVLIHFNDSEKAILWDAGVSENTTLENLHRMKKNIRSISMIALSHGHSDHFTGIASVLKEMSLIPEPKEWGQFVSPEEIEAFMSEYRVPIVLHPAALRERWWKKKDGSLVGPDNPPPIKGWELLGAEMVMTSRPHKLHEGCWTTGYVPRNSFEKSGKPDEMFYRKNSDFLPDNQEDDQAVVINLKNKGLVILSGCAHSGIVNTIAYAREFTGINQVYAVLGGFHLAQSNDVDINKTIDVIKKVKPKFIIPSHCTGLRAVCRFAQEMPEAFIEGVVGATYIF